MILTIFLIFVGSVLALSWYLGRKAKSAQGYFAAHGQVPWLGNGIAFAGDYLSAASFLGICGMIAFYGYDGFLYSIGFLAGWVVALFVIAEPLKKLGKFTFADALAARFSSRAITLTAAIATLVISLFYLIPQMVGAGALIKPLLGLEHWHGVVIVGAIVIFIVATAGMISTTWVQFIKGGLLVLFCAGLTIAILARGFSTNPYGDTHGSGHSFVAHAARAPIEAEGTVLPATGAWAAKPYVRVQSASGTVAVWRINADGTLSEAQVSSQRGKEVRLNGVDKSAGGKLWPVGHIEHLPGGVERTGSLGPLEYLRTLHDAQIISWSKDALTGADSDGWTHTVFYPVVKSGTVAMQPGSHPLFKGVRTPLPERTNPAWWTVMWSRLDVVSLMLALFCGTASLPHILIRYYTVKDAAAARKSTMVGIAAIGIFYVLTLFIGLGAMTSGRLDPSDSNLAAPLLAQAFGELPFACICAIAFTTVLGTVSGLIMAASGAVVQDLASTVIGIKLSDDQKVRWAKIAAVAVGAMAIVLGILFEKFNVTFLVGWAFNIAASANLPALLMLLFWRGTTKQGIVAAVTVGLISSLGWVLMSKEAMGLYGLSPASALVPFSQPALLTVPLGFAVLIVVSLLTRRRV